MNRTCSTSRLHQNRDQLLIGGHLPTQLLLLRRTTPESGKPQYCGAEREKSFHECFGSCTGSIISRRDAFGIDLAMATHDKALAIAAQAHGLKVLRT
jgi:hypothetical protein